MWTDTITVADSLNYDNDFAFQCKAGFDLAGWSTYCLLFRPAKISTINIHAGDVTNFYGVHCAAGISGTVTITLTGSVTFISPDTGALTPSNIAGNVITYNVADFGAVNFFKDFRIVVQTDTFAVVGSLVCITVSVTPTIGDYNPSNNTLTHCFTVVASFDPNNKEVYPIGDIDTTQKWLTYTINFQNTGTAEAEHIYVTDTLDSNVDVNSFQLLAYSHQPIVQLKENAVRFNFPNINLPDSNINEPLSHGYVQYKIKLKDNLPIGTSINNTAFIYFDFNAPVVTNTTTNTITTTTKVPNNQHSTLDFQLFPNPANSSLNVAVDVSFIGSTLTIYDLTGKRKKTVYLTSQYSSINIEQLDNGLYIAEIKTKDASVRKKWTKM